MLVYILTIIYNAHMIFIGMINSLILVLFEYNSGDVLFWI